MKPNKIHLALSRMRIACGVATGKRSHEAAPKSREKRDVTCENCKRTVAYANAPAKRERKS